MIALIRYFFFKAGMRRLGFLLLMPAALLIYSWQQLAPDAHGPQGMFLFSIFPVFMMATFFGSVMSLGLWNGEEFDLILPFRRRMVYAAKSLTMLLLIAISALPVTLAAVACAAHQRPAAEVLFTCAYVAACLAALMLAFTTLYLYARRLPPLLAALVICAPLSVVVFAAVAAYRAMGWHPGLLPLGPLAAGGALAWYIGLRRFDKAELAPKPESGAGQSAGVAPVAEEVCPGEAQTEDTQPPGSLARSYPQMRFMERTLWFRWWYPLIILYGCFSALMFVGYMLVASFIYPLMLLPLIFASASKGILHLVCRQTIFRCVMIPPATAALLAAGIRAIATDSPRALVEGLASVLLWVFAAWAVIPFAREYSWPTYLRRSNICYALIISFVFAQVFWASDIWLILAHLLPQALSETAPWLFGDPWHLSGAIILATAFFWWRAERNFRHYEQDDKKRGFADAEMAA